MTIAITRHEPGAGELRREAARCRDARAARRMLAPALVAGALPERVRGKPVESLPRTRSGVWFQDEARVGQQGTLTRLWARRGTRPRAPRDRRYAWAYLFGAVCPERAVGAALVLPYADTEATGLHLAEIGRPLATSTSPSRNTTSPGATRTSPIATSPWL